MRQEEGGPSFISGQLFLFSPLEKLSPGGAPNDSTNIEASSHSRDMEDNCLSRARSIFSPPLLLSAKNLSVPFAQRSRD